MDLREEMERIVKLSAYCTTGDPKFLEGLKPPEPIPAPTRFSRQRRIEESITNFSPDYNEAVELLDALFAALKMGKVEDSDADVAHYYTKFRRALEAADEKLHASLPPDPER